MTRGSSRPTHYISVTAKVGKGRYEKGPYIGLWESDKGPIFRGSVSGKYLDELYDFIKDFGEDSVSFAIFESRGDRGGRGRRSDGDGPEDQPPRGRGESRGGNRSERSSTRGERDGKEDEDKGGRDKDGRGGRDNDHRRSNDRGAKRVGKGNDWWDE